VSVAVVIDSVAGDFRGTWIDRTNFVVTVDGGHLKHIAWRRRQPVADSIGFYAIGVSVAVGINIQHRIREFIRIAPITVRSVGRSDKSVWQGGSVTYICGPGIVSVAIHINVECSGLP